MRSGGARGEIFRACLLGRGGSSYSLREDGGLGVPLVPVLSRRNPVFMGRMIANEGVFKAGKVSMSFGMAESFGVSLLLSPP